MATIEATLEVNVVESTDVTVTIEIGAGGSLVAGAGLTGGGTFNQSVTIALNAQSIASLELADSALQPGANLSELTNDVGYITSEDLEGLVPSTDLQLTNLPAGATHNLAITPTTGFVDLNANAGAANLTGIQAGYDGQIITVTSRNATNNVTLNRLNVGSDADARMRLSADLTLFQDQGISLRYSIALALWIPMS